MINFVQGLLWASIACFLIAICNQWLWVGELLVSFSLQHLISTIFLVALYAVLKMKKMVIYSLIFLCAQGWFIHNDHAPIALNKGENITILQYNVHYLNKNLDQIVEWIDKNQESFDIVFLQEATPDLKDKIQKLKKHFPYTLELTEERWFGRVLISKLPIEKHAIHFINDHLIHYLVASFKTKEGKKLSFYGIHTTSPCSNNCWNKRNAEFNIITTVVNANHDPYKLIIGDFNITPYSSNFKKVVKSTGMKSAASGILSNTWPSTLKFNLLMIPIDHMLVSPNISVIDRIIGPDLGSDHLPVITHIRLP